MGIPVQRQPRGTGLHPRRFLRLVAGGDTIYLADPDHAVDLVHSKGNVVIHDMVDVLAPFSRGGRRIPDLLEPRPHVSIDPAVRGGEPVVDGTRIPAAEVAALLRDGVRPEQISDYYPGVTPEAAREAADFADYVDSYADAEIWLAPREEEAEACVTRWTSPRSRRGQVRGLFGPLSDTGHNRTAP